MKRCFSKCVWFPPNEHPNFVATRDGVVCVYFKEIERFVLWNPALNEFYVLPKSLGYSTRGTQKASKSGFGAGLKTLDFKVVTTFYAEDERKEEQYHNAFILKDTQVYSLSRNTWKISKGLMKPVLVRRGGAYT
ncbi:hypothetical protein Droror1_Dr00009916 [Drosera rotundifolia]